MKTGDIVRIKDEYCDIGENDTQYLIVEWNIDRGFIIDPECVLPINPTMLVTLDMIDLVGVSS
jgi:hypothetical protein